MYRNVSIHRVTEEFKRLSEENVRQALGHHGGVSLALIDADGNIFSCNFLSKGSDSVEKPGPAEVCSLTNNSSFRADSNTAAPLRPVIVRLLQLGNILRKMACRKTRAEVVIEGRIFLESL